jgi:hypothetical protein
MHHTFGGEHRSELARHREHPSIVMTPPDNLKAEG